MTAVLMVLSLAFVLNAQAPDTLWTRGYGGTGVDVCYSTIETTDGFYVAAGYTGFGSGNQDAWLMKLDRNGDTLWAKPWGGGSPDGAHCVIEASDGGYLVVGYTESYGNGGKDLYLVKTDPNGNLEWSKTYGGQMQDCGHTATTAQGGYMVSGYIDGPIGWAKGDLWILKIDEEGDTLWTKRYGGVGEEYGISIKRNWKTGDGYILCGSTASFGAGGKDAWLLKLDENGDTLWTATFGGAAEDNAYGVNFAHDGGYVLTGYVDGSGSWTPGNVWIIKTDNMGVEEWRKTYSQTGENFGIGISPTTDGGYALTGLIALNSGDLFFLKTDGDGEETWRLVCGGMTDDNALSMCLTSDGGYLAAGLKIVGSAPDFYLVKTVPLINLVSPVGGEILSAGGSHDIAWEFENLPKSPYSLRLLFSYNDGVDYNDTIGAGIEPNMTTYAWNVPVDTSDECRIKIELVTPEGGVLTSDESDETFRIQSSAVGEEPLTSFVVANPSILAEGTTIRYQLAFSTLIKIGIYDLVGKKVTTLSDKYQASGSHSITWSHTDEDGNKISRGVYFLRFQADDFNKTMPIIILK
ncbi:T9SS type A sorting domain-containing protein [candidate division WOR-3 bacterium]|nr:T9SS type A sorting domain-containing protein [candidate division WOR-3 bacterium]